VKKIPLYTPADIAPLTRRYRLGFAVVSLCLLLLLLLFTGINLSSPRGSLALWIIQCVPLLIFIPGLRKHYYRTYSWLCFVLLFYFTAFTVDAMSPLRNWTDYVGVSLSVVMFISAMMASRWRQHQLLAIQQNSSTPQGGSSESSE